MSPVPTFTGLGPSPTFEDITKKVNVLVMELRNTLLSLDSLNVVSLTADHIDTGTLNAGVVTIRGEDGTVYYQIDSTGIVANNGTQNTLQFDLATGILTLIGIILKSSTSNEKVQIDGTGFHSYDSSGVERITIGTTPAKGAKALITRNATGSVQGVYTYDTETVDGASRTGQYITAHGAYALLGSDGDVRVQNAGGGGIRVVALNRPQINSAGAGWVDIAVVGDSTSNTAVADSHNHGLTSSDYIQCYDSAGVATVKKQWVPYAGSSSHSHTLT